MKDIILINAISSFYQLTFSIFTTVYNFHFIVARKDALKSYEIGFSFAGFFNTYYVAWTICDSSNSDIRRSITYIELVPTATCNLSL